MTDTVTVNREMLRQALDALCAAMEFDAGDAESEVFDAAVELRTALEQPAVEPRPVTPYTCPKCHALWLHWPSEQTGIDTDTLNCRSAKWCDYCEKGGVEQLKRLERIPASLKAPVREPSPPPPVEVPLLTNEEMIAAVHHLFPISGSAESMIKSYGEEYREIEKAVRRKAGL